MGLAGCLISLAVVGSYLHALGAQNDVLHARAMALSMLLVAGAGITTGLTRLSQSSPRWLVAGTLLSVLVLVQTPSISNALSLQPLHLKDGILIMAVFVAVALGSRAVFRLLQNDEARVETAI